MDYVSTNEFLPIARALGVVPDVRYTDPRYLVHAPDPDVRRFWDAPENPRRFTALVASVLDGLDPWATCYLWPRTGWGHAAGRPSASAGESVYCWTLRAAGVRPDFDGPVRYAGDERLALEAALLAVRAFGFSVADDVFVVPDHGRQLVMVGHHEAVHVSFADEGRVGPFVTHMADRGFPLPDDLPDATFKRPDWMT